MINTKKQRVLIVSDAKNEADDQFALVHALLTPRFKVVGMVASFFNGSDSTALSYAEMIKIANLTQTAGNYPIKQGAEEKLRSNQINQTEGSRLIVEEALKDELEPLYVICIGGLTDVAAALVSNPEIVDRFILIWVGGGRYPEGSHEANLARDILAANIVFSSEVELWQIPSNAYKTLLVSIAELQLKISQVNVLGAYLFKQLIDFSQENLAEKAWVDNECWVLGDSAAIGVLLNEQKGCYRMAEPPSFDSQCKHGAFAGTVRKIRVYDALNGRMILADLFSKICLFQETKSNTETN